MAITGGFGVEFDLSTGQQRQWVMGRDGVKRWADTNVPTKKAQESLESARDQQPFSAATDSERTRS